MAGKKRRLDHSFFWGGGGGDGEGKGKRRELGFDDHAGERVDTLATGFGTKQVKGVEQSVW